MRWLALAGAGWRWHCRCRYWQRWSNTRGAALLWRGPALLVALEEPLEAGLTRRGVSSWIEADPLGSELAGNRENQAPDRTESVIVLPPELVRFGQVPKRFIRPWVELHGLPKRVHRQRRPRRGRISPTYWAMCTPLSKRGLPRRGAPAAMPPCCQVRGDPRLGFWRP